MLEDIKDMASDALHLIETENAVLIKALSDYAALSERVMKLKYTIESKKNNLFVSGSIAGKNADERAASAWVAIPEYDALAEAEAQMVVAKTAIDVATINANFAKDSFKYASQLLGLYPS